MNTNTIVREKLDKPFKTYDELISLLEERNVIINNKDFAKNCLSDISYHSLFNGYKNLFEIKNDKFTKPILFEHFYLIYRFDTMLNSIILKNIISIEKSLKSKLSYIISEKYGCETFLNDMSNTNKNDYLYINNYRNCRQRNNILYKIKSTIREENKDSSILHYIHNHNHIPCWILVNGLGFGITIKWYNILNSSDKAYVCDNLVRNLDLTIEDKKEFLAKGLTILRKYRNNIAHGQKVFVNSIPEELPKNQVLKISKWLITDEHYRKGIGKNDIFAVIIIIVNTITPDLKSIFLNEIINVFKLFKDIRFSTDKSIQELLSLPKNFIDILEQLK